MNIFLAILLSFSPLSLLSEEKSLEEDNLFCLGIDAEKMPVGTKMYVTCETDPETVENIIVRYCYIENGEAKWSQNYSEFDPEGC